MVLAHTRRSLGLNRSYDIVLYRESSNIICNQFFYCKFNQRNVPLWRSSDLELRGTSPTPLRPRSEPLVERARHVCASSAGTTVGSPRTPRRCAADPRKRRRRGPRPKSRRKDGPCRPTASLVADPAVSTYNRKLERFNAKW